MPKYRGRYHPRVQRTAAESYTTETWTCANCGFGYWLESDVSRACSNPKIRRMHVAAYGTCDDFTPTRKPGGSAELPSGDCPADCEVAGALDTDERCPSEADCFPSGETA